jgi:hypothetical protein
MLEWARTDADFNTRVAHLTGAPGGLNGSFFLVAVTSTSPSGTVRDDGSVDVLSGGNLSPIWIFAAITDTITDNSGAQKKDKISRVG